MGDNSVKGTELKININMTPMDGFHLGELAWKAKVFSDTGFKSVTLNKEDAIRIDEDNYVILVDTSLCGVGKYYVTLEVEIPDTDFKDGTRKEVKTAFTGITIDAK